MRLFLTNIIVLWGRYSVLLIVPVTLAVIWAWFQLLDSHSILGLVLVLPVLVVTSGAIVLVMGILIAGIPPLTGVTVTREEAPVLWDYWDTVSPAAPNTRRRIIIGDGINAAMAEQLRFAGLFGRDQTLIVDLGLLILLDQPAIEAILEHEFAHAELKHSQGLTRLNEFFQTYRTFEDYVEDQLPWVSIVLAVAFHGLDKWLQPELLERSRKCEFEADQQSADRVGVDAQATALILTYGSGELAGAMVYEPIEKELRGALKAPEPPLDRLLRMRDEMIAPANLKKGLEQVLAEEADPESTHPPLAARLKHIGASLDMAIRPVEAPAYETMLPQDVRTRLLDKFNREWVATVDNYLASD